MPVSLGAARKALTLGFLEAPESCGVLGWAQQGWPLPGGASGLERGERWVWPQSRDLGEAREIRLPLTFPLRCLAGSTSSMSHHILTVGDPDFPPPRRPQRLSPLSPSNAPRTRRSSLPPQAAASRTSPPSATLRAVPPLPDNPLAGSGFRHTSTSSGPGGQRPLPTSPPPSPPSVPPELAFELNVSDLEFDDSLLDEPFQEEEEEELGVPRTCPSPGLGLPQLDGLGDAESEDDGEASRYFRFPRTVVTREPPLPPYPLDLPLPHIHQLDGIDDGTDSEADAAGGHPSAKGKQAEPRGERELAGPAPAPEDLPSDIVDFVLKSMDAPEGKAAPLPFCLNRTSPPPPPPPLPPTSANLNGTEPGLPSPAPEPAPTVTLSCAPVPGPPEVKVLSPEGQSPASRIILVNKLGQVCVKMQGEEGAQDGEQASSGKAKPVPLPPPPAPSLGTVILRAPLGLAPSPLPTWTIRGPVLSMVPMMNVVGAAPQAAGGQLALGAPALVTPSLGLPQTCLLQPVAVNSGVLSLPSLVSLPGPRQAIRVKRVSTFVGNMPPKKARPDGVHEEEPLPVSPTGALDHVVNHCLSSSTAGSG